MLVVHILYVSYTLTNLNAPSVSSREPTPPTARIPSRGWSRSTSTPRASSTYMYWSYKLRTCRIHKLT